MNRDALAIAGLAAMVFGVGCRDAPAEDDVAVGSGDEVGVMRPDRACDASDPVACGEVGRVAPDAASALTYFKRACDGGAHVYCYDLASMIENGDGVAVDHARAAVLFGRACEAGETRACGDLGAMKVLGRGVPVDVANGEANLRKACDDRVGRACYNLGLFAKDGVIGGAGGAWLERGCLVNDAASCLELGLWVGNGLAGEAVDPARGKALIERACELGSGDGCVRAAAIAEAGQVSAPDPARAAVWRKKACELGVREACQR